MQSHRRAALVVKQRSDGPTIYAKWRTQAGRQVMRVVGKGWLTSGTGARPNGRTLPGGWRERRGTPPEGVLRVADAWAEVPGVIEAWEAELNEQERRAALQGDRTVRQAVETWLEDGRAGRLAAQDGEPWKHSTGVNYGFLAERVCRELGDVAIEDVTEATLRAFLDGLAPERNGDSIGEAVSRKTRSNYTFAIRGIFASAVAREWIDVDPAAGLRAPRQRRHDAAELRRDEYLEVPELRALVEELRRGYSHDPSRLDSFPRRVRLAEQSKADAAMVLCMGMAGLRLGECLALRWSDLDLAASKLSVRENRTYGRTGTPKSGVGRVVPLAPELAAELARLGLRGYATEPRDLVFVGGRDGRHVYVPRLRDRFYEAQSRAGIDPHRTMQQMRHTFAVTMARNGAALGAVQRWLGHSSSRTTEIYARFQPGDVEAALVQSAFAVEPAT